MRVLEGGRPGYAVLIFDKPIESAALRIAVRSLQVGQGAYLGPNGAFDRTPHYFDAVRVVGPRDVSGYQVGPEIVNYLRENDQIEVSAEDGAVTESGYWENAAPSLSDTRSGTLTLLAGGSAPGLVAPGSTSARVEPAKDKTVAKAEPPQRQETEPPKPPVVEPPAPDPGLRRRRMRRLMAAVAATTIAVAAAAAGYALYQSAELHCSLLGMNCPPPPPPKPTPTPTPTPPPSPKPSPSPKPTPPPEDADAFAQARDCDAEKSRARLYCEEEAACFTPYRQRFPAGPSLDSIDFMAKRAAEACGAAEETEAYNRARQCADGAGACVVSICYVDYQRKYAAGPHAAMARDDLDRAKKACEAPIQPKPTPGAAALQDGEYGAFSASVSSCGILRQNGLHVFVCGGHVRWQHEGRLMAGMQSVPLQWEGTIDAGGAVAATVSGGSQLTANGRLTANEQSIEMRFPSCDTPVPLNITGVRKLGCSGR